MRKLCLVGLGFLSAMGGVLSAMGGIFAGGVLS